MIEAIYKIGKAIDEKDFLDEFIDDPGDKNKHVFKIIVDVSGEKPDYKGIEYEEYDASKKMKYFYKKGSAKGPDKTPTSKITLINRTINNKIKNVFAKYLKDNENFLSETEKSLISKLQTLIGGKIKNIEDDLKSLAKENNYLDNKGNFREPALITFVFEKNGDKNYVGDMDLFVNVFKNNENEAYIGFYNKFGTESRARDKYCYICKKQASEVWGFVNTYNFYTADKESYIAGGFKQELMWKNYPVCSDCAKVLERGKKYIEKELSFRFCGFRYFLIPSLVIDDETLLKDSVLKNLNNYESFSLNESKSTLIENTEEKLLEKLGQFGNQINFNFLFYEASNSAFKILLFLREISPSRLKFLIDSKYNVDGQNRQFNVFKEINTNNRTMNFDFSFRMIRNFFNNSKIEGKYDKYFLNILNDIFIGKKISLDFIVARFMEKIRSGFLNDGWIELYVLQAYKILLYLEEIKILERRRCNMKNYGNNFEDFFEENPIFDDDVKKALFLEGVLAQKLLNIQYEERKATPFRSRLNGLKIDERISKRLLPEIINKLEEYGKNYYRKHEEIIGEYLIKSDFKKYSVDELSYYFTLGMVLAKYFKFDKEEENKQ